MCKICFKNLAVDDPQLKAELLAAVDKVLSHGMLILGEEVDELESALANYCQRKYAVGVGSGSDALLLALRALDIGPGDEVITTPLTWVATTNAVVLTGANPVFADVADDLNIDPEKIEPLITGKTKAILPVNFTGNMCQMDRLAAITEKHRVHLIEDAAQSFGSRYHDQPSGSFGVQSCFSINPMKNLSSYGEAGAVLTDDKALAEKLRSLRYAGTINKEDCHYASINGRIDTLQAAMILVNLQHLPAKMQQVREVAELYNEKLAGIDEVLCPAEPPKTLHSYYSYTVQVPRRDALQTHLTEAGIEVKIQHPILMPQHTAYRGRFAADIPNAERLVARILCLPCHEKMSQENVVQVCEKVKEFYARS